MIVQEQEQQLQSQILKIHNLEIINSNTEMCSQVIPYKMFAQLAVAFNQNLLTFVSLKR